jgi:hypothetical protein
VSVAALLREEQAAQLVTGLADVLAFSTFGISLPCLGQYIGNDAKKSRYIGAGAPPPPPMGEAEVSCYCHASWSASWCSKLGFKLIHCVPVVDVADNL